jgi:hypothetical protein
VSGSGDLENIEIDRLISYDPLELKVLLLKLIGSGEESRKSFPE